MAGRMSRNKGAGGEREVIRLLQPIVDRVCAACGCPSFELIRDGRQRYQKKLYDIFGLPWLSMEVKRVENQSGIEGWWRQVLAATKEGQIPVLLYRQNHGKWKVRVKVRIHCGGKGASARYVRTVVTMTWEGFCAWFEQKLLSELERQRQEDK
jgi:hypothetical protein